MYGNYIVVSFSIVNKHQNDISLSNVALVNPVTQETLHPDLFLTGNEALKTVKSNEETNVSIAFIINDAIKNYSLAILDPLDQKEIVKIPLIRTENKKT